MVKIARTKNEQIYRKFDNTDRLLIEVALDKYEDIFNEWDPAPFKRRDIDPALREFLEECSSEISLKHPLAIAFFLPKSGVDQEKQHKCIEGLKNYFLFNRYLIEKQIRLAFFAVIKHFFIGLTFLFVAVVFEKQFEQTILLSIFDQGLFIGGWLFVWEAISSAAIKNLQLKHKSREWDRFIDAPIVFKKERRADQVFE